MKRKINSIYLLFGVLLAAFFQMSSSENPGNGYTGAPPSGNTCSSSQGGCHNGPAGQGFISIDGLPSTVSPLTVYPITVTLERASSSAQLGGFQLVVQQSNNTNAGMLDNPSSNATVQFTGNKYYAEHLSAPGFSGDVIVFSCDWTSPATATGAITMYAAGNFANGNGSTNGDGIVTTTASTTLVITGGAIGVSVAGTNVSCNGGSNGAATASAAGGGGGPYNYAWSNGETTQTIDGLTPGTYMVTVTNSVGGNGTGSVTITQPLPLEIEITSQTNVTCTNLIGSASADADGGTGTYTYNWSNGQSGTIASLGAGTHMVTATDGNGCQVSTSVTIISDTAAPIASAGQSTSISCTSSTATLNGSGSSQGSNFQYQWTTNDGNILSGATTLSPVVNATGSYTLTVTNTINGCTESSMTTVTGNTVSPEANAGQDAQLTCSSPTIQLQGNAAGTGLTFLWTTSNGNIVSGGTTLSPTVNQVGTYCLTVTNTLSGCSATDCVGVTSNTAAPLASAGSASPLTCSASQVTLNGTASSQGSNFSYQWTTTNGNIVSGGTTLTPVVSIAANYTLTVTNATNGCSSSSSVTVTANTTPPTASAGPDKVLNCNSSSVVLDGSGSSQGGNISYQWSGPGIVSGGTTPNPTVNVSGNYSLLVINSANGCTSTDIANVAQPPTLVASISASQNVACNGNSTGSATAVGTGGSGAFTYLWSNGATTAQITGIAAGTYTVTVKDANNCMSMASVTITQPPVLNPNTSASGVTGVGINNGAATASPMGGVPLYTYLWSNAAGANVGTTPSIFNLAPGNYTVIVTDANNCTASQTITVASFSCAGFGANMAYTNPSCNGDSNGTATVTPTGGASPFSYAWSTGATTSSISGLAAGSYTVSVTDQSGCVVTGNISLVSPLAISLAVQQAAIPCNGSNTAAATVNVTGGTPGYTYGWSNGGTGASQNNLLAGSYSVSVTDANGCMANAQANLVQLPALAGTLTASAESGVNANDGTVSVAMTAGFAPFEYVWTNGATTSAITNLQPGNYCVSVADAFGCTFTGCATVAAFGCAGQALSVTAGNVSCAGSNDGTAQVSATGFQSPITYAWANAAGSIIGTGSAVANLSGGSYAVSVSGADGCQSTQGFTITEPAALGINVLTQNNPECAGEMDGSLTVGGTGGTPGYDFAWSNGATSPSISGLGAGSYTVVVSDANDCTATMSYNIVALPDTQAPVAVATGISVNLLSNGMATITPQMIGSGSTDNCGIASLSLDITAFDCDDLGNNTVTLTVTDAAGNTSTAVATVQVNDEIDPDIFCPSNIVLENVGCSSPVNYPQPIASDNCGIVALVLLSGPPSGAIFPVGTTQVTWYTGDGSGNTAFCDFTVTLASDYNVSTSFTMPNCNGDNNGTATAIGAGGTAPYSYAWDDPADQVTQTATGLEAGTYHVSVMDAEGCLAVETVVVSEPTPISITVDSMGDQAAQLGFISVSLAGGTGGFGYEWLYNNEFFSSEEDIDSLYSGIYTLLVTDQTGCIAEQEIVVSIVDATWDEDFGRSVILAPNPSSGKVFLSFELATETAVEVQVFDLSGKAVTPLLSVGDTSAVLELDLADSAKGVYLLRAIIGGTVVVKRLVIGE